MNTSTASKAPVATPAATTVSIFLALGVVGLGVVAGRDALILGNAISGTPWTTAVIDAVDGLTAQSWMLPAGVAVAVVGLLLLFAAVKPRARTHRPLEVPDAWLMARDVDRVARSAAEKVTGVASATASGSRRAVNLTVTPLGGFDRDELASAVNVAVTESLSALATAPRVKTRVKEEDRT